MGSGLWRLKRPRRCVAGPSCVETAWGFARLNILEELVKKKVPVSVATKIMPMLSTEYHHCFSLVKMTSAAIAKDIFALHSAATRVPGAAVVAHSQDDSIVRVANFLSFIEGLSMT